jgi:CRP-like cAMP-binding protein
MEKSTVLVDSEDVASEAHLLQSGWAMRVQALADGRRSILDIYLPGDLIGYEGLLGRSTLGSVISLTPVVCRSIARHLLVDAVRQSEVSLLLLTISLLQQARLGPLAVALARGTAEERVATFLLNLNARLEIRRAASDGVFRLPMTQQDVSDHLGITVVHVNRVLRRLREGNLASLSNRKAVIDVAGLSRLTECFQRPAAEEIFPWVSDERTACAISLPRDHMSDVHERQTYVLKGPKTGRGRFFDQTNKINT